MCNRYHWKLSMGYGETYKIVIRLISNSDYINSFVMSYCPEKNVSHTILNGDAGRKRKILECPVKIGTAATLRVTKTLLFQSLNYHYSTDRNDGMQYLECAPVGLRLRLLCEQFSDE